MEYLDFELRIAPNEQAQPPAEAEANAAPADSA